MLDGQSKHFFRTAPVESMSRSTVSVVVDDQGPPSRGSRIHFEAYPASASRTQTRHRADHFAVANLWPEFAAPLPHTFNVGVVVFRAPVVRLHRSTQNHIAVRSRNYVRVVAITMHHRNVLVQLGVVHLSSERITLVSHLSSFW
jgi:hypothetical protein